LHNIRAVKNDRIEADVKMNDDGLDIPEFLKLSAERRQKAWEEYDRRRMQTPRTAESVVNDQVEPLRKVA